MSDKRTRLWSQMSDAMKETIQEMTRLAQAPTESRLEDPHLRRQERYEQELLPWQQGGPGMAVVQDMVQEGPYGPLALRLYRPMIEKDSRLIIYVHGGGYVVGGFSTHDRLMRELAHDTGCPLLAFEYRLAPTVHHPAPIDETAWVLSICQKVFSSAESPKSVVLAGDSCGATISLAVALRMRRQRDPSFKRLSALLLFYGGFGLRDSASMRLYGGPWDGMSRHAMVKWRRLYLNDVPPDSVKEWDLLAYVGEEKLLPTFLAVSPLDPFYDDNVVLYELLKRRNEVVFHEEVGVLHGYLQYSRLLPEAAHTRQAAAAFLQQIEK